VTAVGKIFKPALVIREIEDVVRSEAEAAGVALAGVDVKSDARRGLVAEVQLRERSPALRAALGRYAFAAEITEV
jgi:glutathione synthase/RimK-type ligase-like ATP-grasp enzyme